VWIVVAACLKYFNLVTIGAWVDDHDEQLTRWWNSCHGRSLIHRSRSRTVPPLPLCGRGQAGISRRERHVERDWM